MDARRLSPRSRAAVLSALLAFACGTAAAASGSHNAPGSQQQAQQAQQGASAAKAKPKPKAKGQGKSKIDRSGRKQVGKASFYSRKFAGRKMADGTPMQPHGNNAASKTLPLGTTARVTNLETGKSATVTVRDRGPHVPGRIIDVSPATARELGITRKKGVARVEVAPIHVPAPPEAPDRPPANQTSGRKP